MAKYVLTKRAALDLREIYNYSADQWGDIRAEKYLSDLYDAFQHMADEPQIGQFRQYRSAPFLMSPSEKHYAIYMKIEGGIAIATILHSKRDIESVISEIGEGLIAEISVIVENLI